MVVYLASKSQADEFLEKRLFEVDPEDRCSFNCQRFGHQEQGCTRVKVCGNCAAPGHSHDQCDSPIISCANCQEKHRAHDKSCLEPPLNRHKNVVMATNV